MVCRVSAVLEEGPDQKFPDKADRQIVAEHLAGVVQGVPHQKGAVLHHHVPAQG